MTSPTEATEDSKYMEQVMEQGHEHGGSTKSRGLLLSYCKVISSQQRDLVMCLCL